MKWCAYGEFLIIFNVSEYKWFRKKIILKYDPPSHSGMKSNTRIKIQSGKNYMTPPIIISKLQILK